MFMLAERPDDATRRLEHTLELDPSFFMAHWLLGQLHVYPGRFADGLA